MKKRLFIAAIGVLSLAGTFSYRQASADNNNIGAEGYKMANGCDYEPTSPCFWSRPQ